MGEKSESAVNEKNCLVNIGDSTFREFNF